MRRTPAAGGRSGGGSVDAEDRRRPVERTSAGARPVQGRPGPAVPRQLGLDRPEHQLVGDLLDRRPQPRLGAAPPGQHRRAPTTGPRTRAAARAAPRRPAAASARRTRTLRRRAGPAAAGTSRRPAAATTCRRPRRRARAATAAPAPSRHQTGTRSTPRSVPTTASSSRSRTSPASAPRPAARPAATARGRSCETASQARRTRGLHLRPLRPASAPAPRTAPSDAPRSRSLPAQVQPAQRVGAQPAHPPGRRPAEQPLGATPPRLLDGLADHGHARRRRERLDELAALGAATSGSARRATPTARARRRPPRRRRPAGRCGLTPRDTRRRAGRARRPAPRPYVPSRSAPGAAQPVELDQPAQVGRALRGGEGVERCRPG